MIEIDTFSDEPKGPPQEESGAGIVDRCTETAIDMFFEAKNAGMGPLLNAPGIAMLYAEDALLEVELPPGRGQTKQSFRGKVAIQAFFEELTELMVSIQLTERERSVSGRKAIWSGEVNGVHGQSRKPTRLDGVFHLEFDEDDLVKYQWCRMSLVDKPA